MKGSQITRVKKTGQQLMLILWLCAICLAQSTGTQSSGTKRQKQSEDDGLRSIVPEKFVEKRRKRAGRSRTHATYKRVTPTGPSPAVASPSTTIKTATQYAQLGLTIWRLRKSTATDGGAKIVVQQKEGASEWTPIRVEAGKPLAVDDLVRLSIESSIEGYLYVIDRGQYADGTIGELKLIFPTTRTRGGDNSVKPGRLIEIPAQTDSPSYFRLTASHGELVAELLTIVIAKNPIAGLSEQIGSQPLALNKDLFAGWEHDWPARSNTSSLLKAKASRGRKLNRKRALMRHET